MADFVQEEIREPLVMKSDDKTASRGASRKILSLSTSSLTSLPGEAK